MTRDELTTIVRALAPVLREHLTAAIAEHQAALHQTVARVAALETDRPAVAGVPALGDRLTRLEASAATALAELPHLGALRERVAVIEARPPIPGPPGPEGLGFGDLQMEQTDERTITFKAVRGDQVKTLGAASFPVLIYGGVYRAGASYTVGDVVTWEGSSWTCIEATGTKPVDGASCWRLMVKRGRDGKDARGAA